MPPLPDPLYDDAKEKLERLERRINDAFSFQVPRLKNHVGTIVLQQQYAAELREDIESCRRELQILETFVDDIVTQGHRNEMYDRLDTLIPKVDELKKEFRNALLTSKKSIDAQLPSQREELLRSSAAVSAPSGRPSGSDDVVMNASEAVTEALRRTTQLMEQEIERSTLSTVLLEESTQTMMQTSDMYTTFNTLLNTSKNLVTALEQSDWLDRLLILSSLGLFLLVVAYILKKRVIDKGVWLAFWWVKYLPIGKSSAKGSAAKVAQSLSTSSSTSSPFTTLSTYTTLTTTAASSPSAEQVISTISSIIISSIIPTTVSSALASPTAQSQTIVDDAAPPEPEIAAEPEPSLAESIIEDVISRAKETALVDDSDSIEPPHETHSTEASDTRTEAGSSSSPSRHEEL